LNVIEQRYGKSIDKEIAMVPKMGWYQYFQYYWLRRHVEKKATKSFATTPHDNDAWWFWYLKTQCLIFRNRKRLSEEILQRADGFLKIPMVGFTESLNIRVGSHHYQNLTNRLRHSTLTGIYLKKKC
jgi:tRNA (guanosine-2'-O-)-methyltransferase